MLFLQSKPGVNETKSKLTVFSGVILSPETKPIKIYTAPQHTAWAWIETRLSGSRFESRSGQTTVLHVLLLAGDESLVGIWCRQRTFVHLPQWVHAWSYTGAAKWRKTKWFLSKEYVTYYLGQALCKESNSVEIAGLDSPSGHLPPFTPPPPPKKSHPLLLLLRRGRKAGGSPGLLYSVIWTLILPSYV